MEIFHPATILPFLIEAKRRTYAASDDADQAELAHQPSSRPESHDLGYRQGDLFYLDTYLGGFSFIGEEAVWQAGQPVWGMNYYGTMLVEVIPEGFGAFLKQALRQVSQAAPYRGPEHYEQDSYAYACSWSGGLKCFEGRESISYEGQLIYTLSFHGGGIR